VYTAQVSFPATGSDWEAMVDAAQGVLAIWYKNGQIATDVWPAVVDAKSRAHVKFVVSLPHHDSLDERHNNEYVAKELEALAEHGVGPPTIDIWGFDPGTLHACGCARPHSYILFTHFLTKEGAIRCGDCFNPIPLYRLGADDHGEYNYILHWRANYQACDTLQILCSVGEAFGEDQLFHHASQLSLKGLEICRKIAGKTGKPTYYYLFKSRGNTLDDELNRRCPTCDDQWMLSEKWHGKFDFKCDKCCLLSNIACDLEG